MCSMLNASKATWCNECEAGNGDYFTRRELRSSSPLRVATIQTVDIFMRDCYLQ